jgi:hypothetical protein
LLAAPLTSVKKINPQLGVDIISRIACGTPNLSKKNNKKIKISATLLFAPSISEMPMSEDDQVQIFKIV